MQYFYIAVITAVLLLGFYILTTVNSRGIEAKYGKSWRDKHGLEVEPDFLQELEYKNKDNQTLVKMPDGTLRTVLFRNSEG